jgi:hypothetical protein
MFCKSSINLAKMISKLAKVALDSMPYSKVKNALGIFNAAII